MAITYVGGQKGGRTNPSGASVVNYNLQGGLSTTPLAGDLLVVAVVTGSANGTPTMAVTTPSCTALTQQNQNATADTSMNVSWKILAGNELTSVTIPGTTSNSWGEAYSIQVFRGVDPSSAMDVAATATGGTGTGRPNPPAITPTTAGAWVVICGGGAAAQGVDYVAPANFTTNWLTAFGEDNTDAMVGSGYWTGWTSGQVDPAEYTGGTTGANDSWAAFTLALRPLTNAAVSTLTEDFADALDTTNVWDVVAQWNATNTVTGGMLEQISDGTQSTSVAYIQTKSAYDLTGDRCYVKLPQTLQYGGTPTGGYEVNLDLFRTPTTDGIEMMWASDGQLYMRRITGDVITTVNNITYSASTHAWWSIRESNGTVYFDTASSTASNPPQSGDWTNQASVSIGTLGWTPNSVKVRLQVFNWTTMTPATGPAKWDGLNTSATVPAGVTHSTSGALAGQGSAIVGAASRNPAHSFIENFASLNIGGGKWGQFITVPASDSHSAVNGRFVQVITSTGAGNQVSLISDLSVSLIGSSIYIRLFQLPTNGQTYLILEIPGSGGDRIMIGAWNSPATLRMCYQDGYVSGSITDIAYDASTHAWLRLRESGGTYYWDTAPASASNPPQESDWTNRKSLGVASMPGTFGTAVPILTFSGFGTSAGGTVIWDGLNTSASITHSVSGALVGQGSAVAGAATRSKRSLSLLTDEFASIDSGKWGTFNTNGTISIVNGALDLTTDSSEGSLAGIESVDSYKLDETGAYVQVVRPMVGTINADGARWVFRIFDSAADGDYVEWFIQSNGLLVARTCDEGTPLHNTVISDWSSTDHKWLKITLSGGTATWWTAPDSGSGTPGTWTSRHTYSSLPSAFSSVKAVLMFAQWGTGCGTIVDSARFDGFNTTGTLAPVTHAATGVVAPVGSSIAGSASRSDAGGTTHLVSGVLAGGGSNLDGTASRIRVHDASGVLTGEGSIDGVAARTRVHDVSGVLTGEGSDLDGTAVYNAKHAATGVLSGESYDLDGVAARTRVHDVSGVLVGEGPNLDGAASRFVGAVIHSASGVLSGESDLDGVAARTRVHDVSGVLTGESDLDGVAARTRVHDVSGVLTGESDLDGVAARTRVHDVSGVLAGQATVSGASTRFRAHDTTGVLLAGQATVSGTSSRFTGAIAHATTGTLTQIAEVSGTSTRFRMHDAVGALSAQSELVGAAAKFAKHETTGALYSLGGVIGLANRTRDHQTVGVLASGEGSISGVAFHLANHQTTGVLSSTEASVLAATSHRFRTFGSTGAINGVSVLSGAAHHKAVHSSTGILVGPGAQIAGSSTLVALSFDGFRQAILANLVSARNEPHGWNIEKANIPLTAVVRTSDTVVTITLPPLANYDIIQPETITATIPAGSTTGGQQLVAAPTFTISNVAVSHATTGAIAGTTGAVVASAIRFRSFDTTGALIGVSAVSGSANRSLAHLTTGALVADLGEVSGTSRIATHHTTGVISAEVASVSGATHRTTDHRTTGAAVGTGSLVLGEVHRATGSVAHDTTGIIQGVGSAVQGSVHRTRIHGTTGTVLGGVGTVAASAHRTRAHATTGAILVGASQISGLSNRTRVHLTTGAVLGGAGSVQSSVLHLRAHEAEGAIAAGPAAIAGSAVLHARHYSTGSIAGSGSLLAGQLNRSRTTTGQLVVVEDPDLFEATGTAPPLGTRTGWMVAVEEPDEFYAEGPGPIIWGSSAGVIRADRPGRNLPTSPTRPPNIQTIVRH